jgi:hypothetical protein
VVLSLSLVAAAAACTSSSSDGVGPPSTFGADSPWVGTLTGVALPVPVNSLTSLDCLGATHCWATGSTVGVSGAPNGAAMAGTDDGGARWTGQNVPGTVSYLSAVGCSDTHRCTAVGQGVQSTTTQAVIIDTVDGGHTWAQVATPPGVLDMSAVTCMADGRCVAIGATGMGDAALISTSTGSAWTQAGALPAGMTGARDVACSNDEDCWVTARSTAAAGAVSGAIALTTDGGASWTALPIPAGTGLLNGIACIAGATTGSGALPGSTTVAGSAGSSTTAPVVTTTTAPPTTTTPPVPPVGVPGVRCTAVGTTSSSLVDPRSGHGVILTTANGGASWAQQPISGSVASLADISCTAINTCVAVGTSVATVADQGVMILTGSNHKPWSRSSLVSTPQPLSAVSCASTSQCVAVGESVSEYFAT